MSAPSTDDKKSFGQLIDEARDGQAKANATPATDTRLAAEAFYAKYKDWVDIQNEHVEKYGVFGEEYRSWCPDGGV